MPLQNLQFTVPVDEDWANQQPRWKLRAYLSHTLDEAVEAFLRENPPRPPATVEDYRQTLTDVLERIDDFDVDGITLVQARDILAEIHTTLAHALRVDA